MRGKIEERERGKVETEKYECRNVQGNWRDVGTVKRFQEKVKTGRRSYKRAKMREAERIRGVKGNCKSERRNQFAMRCT